MAQTDGYVHQLDTFQYGQGATVGGFTCAKIGPDSTNVTALFVSHVLTDNSGLQGFKDSIVAVLTAAMVTGKEVRAHHGDYDSEIVWVTLPKPLV